MRTSFVLTSLLVAVATVASGTTSATADPNIEYLPMTCSDGRSVLISPAPANGTFTPNFDSGSTAVFLPESITLVETLRDAQGAVVGVETAPAQLLGHGHPAARRPRVTCSASETLTAAQDPEVPAGDSLQLDITLIGSWTPAG